MVCNTKVGADSKLIDSLPRLEIVASYSVGLDKIDLCKCKKRGIRVTNAPDVLTDDVTDCGIGLALATLRKLCSADRFVRSGSWRNGEFGLAMKCGSLQLENNVLQMVDIQWRKVQDLLEDDERCIRLDKIDRLDIFRIIFVTWRRRRNSKRQDKRCFL